jgi:cyclase
MLLGSGSRTAGRRPVLHSGQRFEFAFRSPCESSLVQNGPHHTRRRSTVHRTLIVARMNVSDEESVAKVFAESDATELPHMIGVSRRTLFSFHDLYFHLVEADADISPNLYRARPGELYRDINTKLGEFISPYDPNWKEPKDAMAKPFYVWTPDAGRTL